MVEALKEVLDLLDKLNSKVVIVSKEDIEEQYDNLEDFRDLLSEFDILLNSFATINVDDGNEVVGKLLELHRMINTFIWNFSEVSDLNIKVFKEYKDKINNIQ